MNNYHYEWRGGVTGHQTENVTRGKKKHLHVFVSKLTFIHLAFTSFVTRIQVQ